MAKKKKAPIVENPGIGCVIYTDGGCRPGGMKAKKDPIGGWGIHGYVYEKQPNGPGLGLKDWIVSPIGYMRKEASFEPAEGAYVSEFTNHLYDTSARPLPNIKVIAYIDGFGSLIPESTNNHAEATALFRALYCVLEYNDDPKNADALIEDLFIIADSEYVIKGYTEWLDKWVASNFTKPDGSKYANEAIWMDVYRLKQEIKKRGIKVRVKWVAGHSGDLGNELADYHATNGHYVGTKGQEYDHIELNSPKGYWQNNANHNPFFTHNRCYFTTHSPKPPFNNDTQHYVYHIGTHGKEDDFAGKAISDASFAVLYLKKPVELIETLRFYQYELEEPNFMHMVAVRMDNLHKSRIEDNIGKHGHLLLRHARERKDVFVGVPFVEGDVNLTREFKPPKIATRLIDVLNDIEVLLYKGYIKEETEVGRYDITDLFYDHTEDKKGEKKTLKKDITNTTKSVVVDAELTLEGNVYKESVTLTLGIDLPTRNALAKFSHKDTRLTLMCWGVSENAIRFGTVLDCQDEYGMWCGPYSNIHLLNG